MTFNELEKLFYEKYPNGKISKVGRITSVCFDYKKLSESELELLSWELVSNTKTSATSNKFYDYKGYSVYDLAVTLKLITKEVKELPTYSEEELGDLFA